MLETERISLPDGHWWEVKTVVTRGMRKAFNRAATTGALGSIKTDGLAGLDLANEVERQKFLMAHLSDLDVNAVDDAMLLGGTVGSDLFSALDQETLDSLPERYVEPVLARMRELYAPLAVSTSSA